MIWSTACPDWRERIVNRESLIPIPPLFADEAAASMEVFDSLHIVDAIGQPTMGEAARPWVRDFAASIFGALNPETGQREIREFFLLISKKNGKSTDAAAIMLTELVRNERRSAEFLILAPTIEVANNSYFPARDMVRADETLDALLQTIDHQRTIKHRETGAILKVVAADSNTVSGKKATGVLVDELWLFGKNSKADAMLREATGGQVSRPEGFTIYLTTQADEQPAGVFKAKLDYFRDVRDGKIADRKSLGVLYEFPEQMLEDRSFLNPANFYVTNPNLGVSVDQVWLEDEYRKVENADDGGKQVFLAKHLNVEIGLALRNNAWAGAAHWETAKYNGLLTLESLLERCEVAVIGIDGGGLDDLLGLAVLGRCRETQQWLLWNHAWAHGDVLERRKEIAPRLKDFERAGELTICEWPTQDVEEVAEIAERVRESGKMPESGGIGVDASGIASIVDELSRKGFTTEGAGAQILAVQQGWRLNGAVSGMPRKLMDGTLKHAGQAMMAWCVGNAKAEVKGNNMYVTKQIAGKAKIDPLVASFNAVMLMSRNPEALGTSVYEDRGLLVFG